MKLLLALIVATTLAACGSSDNLKLIKSGGTAVAKIEIRPDMTPSLTGAGSASLTYLTSPMVRQDAREEDYTLVKTRGVCGQWNYTSYMIVTEGQASANAGSSGAALAAGFNEGIYGGHVADYLGLAALATAMGSSEQGGDPSFTYDCSRVVLPDNTLAPGPTGPVPSLATGDP